MPFVWILLVLPLFRAGGAFTTMCSKHGPAVRLTTVFLRASIVDQVTDQMKEAMKAKDTAKLSTIRLIRSSFANAAIDLQTQSLSDEQAVTVLRKMAKMRQESIDMYTKGGATDRADAERTELAVIQQWLPQLADDAQTREWVLEAIDEAAGSDNNMGKVMGALMKKHKAELDGGLAKRIVQEELAKK